MDIFLASSSPRRAELLRQVKIPFTIKISDFDEGTIDSSGEPQEWVQQLALAKANKVAEKLEQGLVIGADTIVVHKNRVLGKPKNPEEAVEILTFLSNSTHQVITGIALVNASTGEAVTDVEITLVKFRKLGIKEIQSYVATGEPGDKAGAYGIQGLGALLVEGISGCYFNVVGLPLNRLTQKLSSFGIEIFTDLT